MYKDSRSKENKRDLLRELIKTSFKLRYNNSFLGFTWVLLKPILKFTILFVVFTAFRGGEPNATYAANLLLGIIIFAMVEEGIVFGMHSLMDLAGVILKINFPRQLAVTSSLFMALINFFFNIIIIIIIAIASSTYPSLMGIGYFLGIMVLLFILLYSAALVSSILFVKIRDLDHIMDLAMQMLFWGSAIFYNLDDMSGTFHKVLMLNPFAVLIDAARKAIMTDEIVHLKYFGVYWIAAIVLFFYGTWYFNKNIKRIAEDF